MANLSNINGKFVVEQSTGYVGIGTTDPNFLIEAAGANSEIALNSTSASVYRLRSTSSDSFIITKNGVGDRLVINGAGNATFAGTITAGNGNQGINGDADLTLRNVSSGFVGIDFKSNRTSGNIGGLRYYGTASDSTPVGQFLIETDGQLKYYNGTNGAQSRLTIDSSGNTTFAGDVTISKAATPLFKLLDTTNNISLLLGADDANTFIRSSSSANLYLQPGGSTALTLLSGGNVGIGTTSPTNYLLDVDGTVKGDSFSVDGLSARIFAPSGATYNGSGSQTGYLIVKLPDLSASGINNMMTGIIRVFDYAGNESFDVHFAGYWYSGYNWTNCSAWIDSQANVNRNFTVRWGSMPGNDGAGSRPFISIGDATSSWNYVKFSVVNYEPGHSNNQAYKWDSGWNMDLSTTLPGTTLRDTSTTQSNNWARTGEDLYYGSGGGNVGIGNTSPGAKLDVGATIHANTTGIDVGAGAGGGNCIGLTTANNHNWFPYTDGNNYYSAAKHQFRGGTNNTPNYMMLDSAGLGIGTTTPVAKLDVYQGSEDMVQRNYGPANNQGSPQKITITKWYPVTSLGTKLLIPVESQGSLNMTTIVRMWGHSAVFNRASGYTNRSFTLDFTFGSLRLIYGLTTLNSTGNVSSVTQTSQTSGVDGQIQVNFTNSYMQSQSGAAYGGVYITLEYMTGSRSKSIIPSGIALN